MQPPAELHRYKFEVGQVVRHRRYGYRGVIYGMDPYCRMPDAWYFSNPTQPDRDRPWYRVFVHRGQETYVAEANLLPDPEPEPVEHPMVRREFPTFHEGRYYRQGLN